MTYKELITKFGFEIHEEPLEKVEKRLDGIKERLEFLGAAEVLKGIYELAEKFSHFAEELHVASVSAGLTVEAFQKLAFAAGQSAVTQDEMAGAMARLGRNLYEARMGSVAAQQAFINAGFTGTQVQNFHTASDAMLALADRFKDIQDPIQKSALAMQLMGRGSVNMVGFLSQGSAAIHGLGNEAERLGIVLSEHQVAALVKVEHALNEITGIFRALSATIASYFAPSIERAIQEFIKFYEVNRRLIETNLRAWVWDITFALGFVWEAVKTVTQAFFDFAESHQTLTRRAFELLVLLGGVVATIWILQKTISIVMGSLGLLGDALAPIGWLWMNAFQPAILWVGGLVRLLGGRLLLYLATLTETALPGLSAAFLSVGAAIEATPIGWLITGVAALVVILHDAWTLLSGGNWEDTWIAKAFSAVKGFGGKALAFLGLGGTDQDQTNSAAGKLQAMQNLSDIRSIGQSPNPVPNQGVGDQAYSVNAPITINIPGVTDHKMVGEKVKEGVKEHLDGVYRKTQQALRPAQAY